MQKDCKKREKAYGRAHPVVEQKPFVIVIRSYNNGEWYEKNLLSVFEQKYDRYRVIYIDDASTDGTYEKVKSYLEKMGRQEKVTLIHNESNQGAMANIYTALHTCADAEIAVLLDGDDWFAHNEVLKRLNEVYADENIWMTYGSYVTYPTYQRGIYSREMPSKIIEQQNVRKYAKKELFFLSHLMTFYTSLFKEIPLLDLTFQGKFLDSASDVAFMIPIAEMANKRSKYLDEVLYVYNRATPIADDRVRARRQYRCSRHALSLKPYKSLDELPVHREEVKKADLLVFSFDRPMQLYACLESIEKFVVGLDKISVLYRSSDKAFEEGYTKVKNRFTTVTFIPQSDKPHEDFKPLVLSTVYNAGSKYITFAVDDIIVTDQIDFSKGIAALEKTHAYGFYYRLGNHVDYSYMLDCAQSIPPLNAVGDGIFAWNFGKGEGDWRFPNTVDFTLYKKSVIEKNLRKINYSHPNFLESEWTKKRHLNSLGLCYLSTKIVNIPLNIVNISEDRNMMSYSPLDLLIKFNEDLKIDIAPLYKIKNRSPHIHYNPQFTTREGGATKFLASKKITGWQDGQDGGEN
jgi:glycosyltransferase involved in cell wall biosynthesis